MDKTGNKLKQNDQGLKRSILAHMIIFPFIPFLLVLGISFYFFASALETKTREGLERTLADHGQMIDAFLMERKADLELITHTYEFDRLNTPRAIHGVYRALALRSPAFVDLGLFDETGLHLRYSGAYPLKGKSYAGEAWFKKTMERGFYISDVFLGFRKVPHFVIGVRRTQDNRTWVIRATIDTLFFNTLVSSVRIGKTGEAYILNRDGKAQTPRRSGDIGLLDQDPSYLRFAGPSILEKKPVCISPEGQPYLYAAIRLEHKPWFLVVRQEKQDAYGALYSAMAICLVVLVCGTAVLVVTAFFTTQRILRRITLLDREKEQLDSQLIRASQLAEIGEMAAGFAHEINNPLQIIKSEYALLKILVSDLAAKRGKPDTFQDIWDGLNQIHSQVERCTRITQAILKFGRKTKTEHRPVNPSAAIPEILSLVDNKAKVSGIEILLEIHDQTPAFMGDMSRFQQVLLNLVNNAVDAVTERHGSNGGQIRIQAGPKEKDQVEIRIIDNGSGIRPEYMDKIFSPFFTTKAVGRGTGLGLSVCFGIIESFGGTMHADSRQGEGTTFAIILPAQPS